MNDRTIDTQEVTRWEFIEIHVDLQALKRGELVTQQERQEILALTEDDAFSAGLDRRADPGTPWELANTYVFPIPGCRT